MSNVGGESDVSYKWLPKPTVAHLLTLHAPDARNAAMQFNIWTPGFWPCFSLSLFPMSPIGVGIIYFLLVYNLLFYLTGTQYRSHLQYHKRL